MGSRLSRVAVLAAVAVVLTVHYKYNKRFSVVRWLVAYVYSLRKPTHHALRVLDDVKVAMRDGVELEATVLLPHTGMNANTFPCVVIRSPYNRNFARFAAERFAERGYNVVLQDIRGRFGSDGHFSILKDERDDGVDTLRWIKKQEWCLNPTVGMWGISYVGFAAWATVDGVAQAHAAAGGHDDSLPKLAAIAPAFTSSDFYPVCFPDKCVGVELLVRWMFITHNLGGEGLCQPRPRKLPLRHLLYFGLPLYRMHQNQALVRCLRTTTFNQMQSIALNLNTDNLLVRMELGQDSEFWKCRSHSAGAGASPPVHIMAGWFDLLLRECVADFNRVVSSGRVSPADAYITIAPYHHFESLEFKPLGQVLGSALDWFDSKMKNQSGLLRRKPIQLFVMFENNTVGEWREFDRWPPVSNDMYLYLYEDRMLREDPPTSDSVTPASYTFDPNNPTHCMGGPRFSAQFAGMAPQETVESRADVLVFTSDVLTTDVEIIGAVSAEIWASSVGGESFDVVVRLCDVAPNGVSLNVCEGVQRIVIQPGADSSKPMQVQVDMWYTAKRFRVGHRIRVQVCSGSEPRILRNFGVGDGNPKMDDEPARLLSTTQSIYFERRLPSRVILPAVGPAMASHGSQAKLTREPSQAMLTVLSPVLRQSFADLSQL